MDGYFYHGIEFYPGTVGSSIELLINILDDGLVLRSQARGFDNEKMNHICLYKKNESYDYNSNLALIHSARGGWIDGQFVFVINPNLEAVKAQEGIETNLVDEWRCFENISPENFVAIGLPFNSIEEYLNEKDDYEFEDKKIVSQYLPFLIEKINSMGLTIVNSNEKEFTDILDMSAKSKGSR